MQTRVRSVSLHNGQPAPAGRGGGGGRPGGSLPARYRRGRAAAALVALLVLFLAAWSLNGHTTAVGVGLLVPRASYLGGWCAHVVLTLVELSVPVIRPYLRGAPVLVLGMLYAVVVVVGVVDVGSFAVWALALVGGSGLLWASVATLAGEAIAIMPEPVIVALVVALWRLWQNPDA